MAKKYSEDEVFIKPLFADDKSKAFSILNSIGYKGKLGIV